MAVQYDATPGQSANRLGLTLTPHHYLLFSFVLLKILVEKMKTLPFHLVCAKNLGKISERQMREEQGVSCLTFTMDLYEKQWSGRDMIGRVDWPQVCRKKNSPFITCTI